jgi:hypothetical protein
MFATQDKLMSKNVQEFTKVCCTNCSALIGSASIRIVHRSDIADIFGMPKHFFFRKDGHHDQYGHPASILQECYAKHVSIYVHHFQTLCSRFELFHHVGIYLRSSLVAPFRDATTSINCIAAQGSVLNLSRGGSQSNTMIWSGRQAISRIIYHAASDLLLQCTCKCSIKFMLATGVLSNFNVEVLIPDTHQVNGGWNVPLSHSQLLLTVQIAHGFLGQQMEVSSRIVGGLAAV